MEDSNVCIKGIQRLINLLGNNFSSFKVGSSRLWNNTGWENTTSKRHDFEIFLFTSESVIINIGDKEYPVEKGDIVFIDNSLGNSCVGGNFKMYYIQFSFSDKDVCLYLRQQVKDILDSFSMKIHPESITVLEDLCKNCSFELSVKKEYYHTRAKYLFIDFLIQLSRILSNKVSIRYFPSIEKYKNEILEIASYLSKNLEKKHSLSELSKKIGLNERYFNLLFKSTTGYPVFQYLLRLRVDMAKRLLETTKLSITEISYELGFDSSQYFCKIFKSVTGVTPSKFREIIYMN